jgi:hypothetical protein
MPESVATEPGRVGGICRLADEYRHNTDQCTSGCGVQVPGDSSPDLRVGWWARAEEVRRWRRDDHEPEIIKFEPDHSVSMRIESTGFIMLTRFHLFESDGVTTVRQSVQLSYKRWYRLFVRITNRSVQRRITADLERLKKTVEDRTESDSSAKRIA